MQILDWENKTGVHFGSVAIQNVINYYVVVYIDLKVVNYGKKKKFISEIALFILLYSFLWG